MAIRISPPRDDRIERALANPARYFADAWRRARAHVVATLDTDLPRRPRRAERLAADPVDAAADPRTRTSEPTCGGPAD